MVINRDQVTEKCLNVQPRRKIEYFDDVLPYVGDFEKYQWTLLSTVLIFGSAFATVFFSQIFITVVPQNHWCKVQQVMGLNLTQELRRKLVIPQSKEYPYYDRCHHKKLNMQNIRLLSEANIDSLKWETDEVVQCNQWEYNFNEVPYASISVELHWICDKEYLIATAQSIFYVGSVFGNFIFGWISDQKGRIVGLLCCTATAFFASIGTANAHNFWSFALSRFLIGFSYDNIIIIPLIIVLEYTTPKKRAVIGCFTFGFSFAIGIVILTWSSYFISNWRTLAYVNSVPCLLGFLIALTMPESIRWYMSKGKADKILEKLRRISAVNNKYPEPRVYDEFLENMTHSTRNVENVTILDLKKTPSLAKNIGLLALVFSLSSFIMDTHIYYSARSNMTVFTSFSLFSLELFITSVFGLFTAKRWGLRFSGFLGLFLGSVFSFTFVFFKEEAVKSVTGSIARMSVCFVQVLYSQYVPEFFPTSLRTQGAALVHFWSVLMHFLAPYLIVLASTWRELPMLIIAILAALNSGLILLLPETAGKNLRQTLQEGEDFCRNKKFWPIFVTRRDNL